MRAGLISFGAVAGLAAANGGYFPDAWGPAVVALAWAAVMLLVLDRRPALPGRGEALLALACAVAAWTAVTAFWSDSVTSSLLEAERSLVVVAAVLALLLARDRTWMLRGVVAAAAVVASWNLVAGGEEPVGYANGIGAIAAVAIPLALRERATWPAVIVLAPVLARSHSRGAWLALALAAIVAAVRRPVLVVPAAAIALALAWVVETRRAEYFPVALDEARAAPVAGTGAGTSGTTSKLRRRAAERATRRGASTRSAADPPNYDAGEPTRALTRRRVETPARTESPCLRARMKIVSRYPSRSGSRSVGCSVSVAQPFASVETSAG